MRSATKDAHAVAHCAPAAGLSRRASRENNSLMIISSVDSAPVSITDTGSEIRVLLDTTRGGQGRLSLAVETLKPGQSTAPHWHANLEEVYFIVAGRGRMEIGAEARAVIAGDAILIPINRVHCLRNTGNEDLVILCPVSPPWVPEDYRVDEVDDE